MTPTRDKAAIMRRATRKANCRTHLPTVERPGISKLQNVSDAVGSRIQTYSWGLISADHDAVDALLVMVAIGARRMNSKAMRNRSSVVRVFALMLALLFSSFSQAMGPPNQLTPVRVQLNWRHQFEFAAFYAAQAQGYYREAGLDIEFREIGTVTDLVGEVTSGRAQFGVTNGSLILEHARGKPVLALGALMQHSAVALLASRERGVSSVGDLEGKTVQCPTHSCDEIKAYLKISGVNIDKIDFVGALADLSIDLTDRFETVDATEAYSTSAEYLVKGREHLYILLLPRSAGIDLYGNILFTDDAMLQAHPQLVARFRKATFRGLAYATEHPEEVVDLIISKYNTQNRTREHLLHEARKLHELTRTDLVEPGYMSVGRWGHTRDVYAAIGALPANYDFAGLIYESEPRTLPVWLIWFMTCLMIVIAMALSFAFKLNRINRKLTNEIVDRQQAEAELKSSQNEFRTFVDQANVLVSHELRTPLSAIKMNLEILELKYGSTWESAHNVRAMQQAALRLKDLFEGTLKQIFNATSLAGKRRGLIWQSVVTGCVDEFIALWPLLTIRVQIALSDPLEVLATEDLLKTAILNLLENAAKYAPGGAEVLVELTTQDKSAVVTVSNPSSQIFPPDFDSLFEMHVRGNVSPGIPGTGVGLYLVRLIAEAHGGNVRAWHSASDIFTVQLKIPINLQATVTNG